MPDLMDFSDDQRRYPMAEAAVPAAGMWRETHRLDWTEWTDKGEPL